MVWWSCFGGEEASAMSTSLRPPAPAGAQRSVSGRRRPSSRLERSRAAAGLVAVCVLALGVTAC